MKPTLKRYLPVLLTFLATTATIQAQTPLLPPSAPSWTITSAPT